MSCLMYELQERLPFECFADLPIIQMIVRLTYHMTDYYIHLTLKTVRLRLINTYMTEI